MPIKIITTEDGSHSLFDEELNETYHSTRGARGESMHVFLKEGLEHWHSLHHANEIRILEVGFGTGLNAFLTAQYAKQYQVKVHFTTLEPFPIEASIYQKLNYHQTEEERQLLTSLHEAAWGETVPISPYFNLLKSTSRLEDFNSSEMYQVIYFDAFAPSKQPEVWSIENLRNCFNQLSEGGMLTTYCAQGQFKRNLVEAGFSVETLRGAMGKKEMVRGVKP